MTYRITACFLLAFACGCSCPGARPESARSGEAPTGSPAAVQQNFSYVEGVVDSVLPVDAQSARLVVTVTSARAGSSGTSMVETGTQLTVTPGLRSDARPTEFYLHPKQGDRFAGSLTRAQDGHWILLDAAIR